MLLYMKYTIESIAWRVPAAACSSLAQTIQTAVVARGRRGRNSRGAGVYYVRAAVRDDAVT